MIQPHGSCQAIGTLITANMSRKRARTALHDAGWEFLDGGSYASVWGSPDGTRVAKVTKPDGGQRALIAAAKKHPDNPNLPTIYGFLQLKRGGFVVEMELLDWDGDYGEVAEFDGSAPSRKDIDAGYVTPEFYAAWHAVQAERSAAREKGIYLDWDLHDENVMFRNGTPVLVDPLYEPRRHHAARTGTGNAELTRRRYADDL
jgi:hypothetical protein